MAFTTVRVRLHVPADDAAALWQDVEHLDRWIGGLGVTGTGAGRTRWQVRVFGRVVTFDAEQLHTDEPPRLLWRSFAGPEHCGDIVFTAEPTGCTATVRFAWRPHGLGERLAQLLRLPKRRIRSALREFREQTAHLPPLPQQPQPVHQEHEPIVSPGDAPLGTPGTAYGPLFPYTAPEERG